MLKSGLPSYYIGYGISSADINILGNKRRMYLLFFFYVWVVPSYASYFVLLGETGVGKSSAVKLWRPTKLPMVGHTFSSETDTVTTYAAGDSSPLKGNVTDTPGLLDTDCFT